MPSKIMAFLLDNEVEFDLPGLPAATTHYKSAAEAVGVALGERGQRSPGSSMPWRRRRPAHLTTGGLQFCSGSSMSRSRRNAPVRALLDLLAQWRQTSSRLRSS